MSEFLEVLILLMLISSAAWLLLALYRAVQFWWRRRQVDRETRAIVDLQRMRERELAAVISLSERRR